MVFNSVNDALLCAWLDLPSNTGPLYALDILEISILNHLII